MEKRVIKFNLVGAILVLILIIALSVAIIVGTVIMIYNSREEEENNKDKVRDKSEVVQSLYLQTW